MRDVPSDDRAHARAAIVRDLGRTGFARAAAADMRAAIGPERLARWEDFAATWNDLGRDRYMADGGRYRRRRHAAFSVGAAGIVRKSHQPHYQSRDVNTLNGGIERWFEPLLPGAETNPVLGAVLSACRDLFETLTPEGRRPPAWHVELHQFRIEARAGEAGLPTPEGAHRDGVDWVLVLLVARENVASGETVITGHDGTRLGAFTLTEPLDAAWVDDDRVFHGVTPVTPLDPALAAWRDVLVVTFRR